MLIERDYESIYIQDDVCNSLLYLFGPSISLKARTLMGYPLGITVRDTIIEIVTAPLQSPHRVLPSA